MKNYWILIFVVFFYIISCLKNRHCTDAIFPKADTSYFFKVNHNAITINKRCAKQCKWEIFKDFMYFDAFLFDEKGKIYYIIQDSTTNHSDSSHILFDYSIHVGKNFSILLPLYIWNNHGEKPILKFRYYTQEFFLSEKFYDNAFTKDTIYKFFVKNFNGLIGDDHLLIYFCRSKGIVGMANQVGEIEPDKVIINFAGNIYYDTLYANKRYDLQ